LVLVLFDSSFLMAIVEHPTTWFEDITDKLGKVRPAVLKCTVEELQKIAQKQLKKSRTAALALELTKDFAVERSGSGKVDDEIVSYALGAGCVVATLDRELIRTLKSRKVRVLELRSGRVAEL
jgi:rRNA-processing protein FCF1